MEKQKQQKFRKIFVIMFTLVCYMLVAMVSPLLDSFQFVNAEETALGGANKFDTTNVLDDLLSADEKFIENYPPNENADPKIQVINFVEYCYSYRSDKRSNYGLYVYVYNPTGMNIHTWAKDNQIQLGVAYDSDPVTTSSQVTDYEKFDLKFCNASQGQYANLYFKFRVVDRVGKDGKLIAQRVNPTARRYDVSGIEIVSDESSNAIEYTVANTYTFTGYAKGCSFNEDIDEDTLQCESGHLDVISLDVKHTFYRTETSSKGAGWHNQIDSVYFTVPDVYFEKYGNLQRIKAEWYEFVTKDIIVTSQKEFYDAAINYVGQKMRVGHYSTSDLYWCLYNDGTSAISSFFEWNRHALEVQNNIESILYLFYTSKFGSYDPTASVNSMGGVSGEDLLQYIREYNKSFNDGTVEVGKNSISADLFENDIQEDRKINNEVGVIQSGFDGKSYYDFDASLDLLSLMSWSDTEHSFWDNVSNWGFFNALFGSIPKEESVKDITPIYIVTAKDMAMSDADLIKNLYINADDVQAFRNEFNQASLNHEKLVLFRFAKSDYFSQKLVVCHEKEPNSSAQSHNYYDVVYDAKETVFMNFDIIQLTFLQKDIYTVIPVVSSPIDIVDAITPPAEFEQWWQKLWDWIKQSWKNALMFALSCLVGIVVVVIVIVLIFKLLVWLIKAPFSVFKD